MQKSTKFFAYLVSTIIVLILAIGTFNLVIDPYAIYRLVEWKGVNRFKPAIYTNAESAKAQALSKLRPRALVLGSSRAELGINPDSDSWLTTTTPRYNASLASSKMHDLLVYFEYAQSIAPVQDVILGVDLMMFIAEQARTKESGLTWLERLEQNRIKPGLNKPDGLYHLFSIDALKASMHTIRMQDKNSDFIYRYNGMRSIDKLVQRQAKVGHRQLFIGSEKRFIYQDMYRARANKNNHAGFAQSLLGKNLQSFATLVKNCTDNNINLSVYISPIHARQLEIIHLSGAWSLFEEWKKAMVDIVDKTRRSTGKQNSMPLWDFSLYNDITTEPVPVKGDRKTSMTWYWESSHFKEKTGDLILKTLFSQNQVKDIPPNFGVKLTKDNIHQHLTVIRDDRQKYQQHYQDDVQEIKNIFSRSNSRKHE